MKCGYRKILTLVFALIMALALAAGLAACNKKPKDNSDGNDNADSTVKYTLSYGRGAYAAAGDMPESKTYEEGEEVTLAPATTFTLDGYCFAGWSDGTQTYEGGATITMPAHDVKLMATWELPFVVKSVGFEDGNFVVKGNARNVESLYVSLNNTEVAASVENYVQAEITGGAFTARIPLSTLIGYNKVNTPFNLRYKTDDLSSDAIGIGQGDMDLSETYKYNEHSFRLAVNSGTGCVAVYYAAAPDTTVNVSAASVGFEDGYFVVTGTVQNVEELYIYLINTNVTASVDNYVEAVITDNTFTANLPLSTLIGYGKQNTPFNLRYRANDSQINVNIEQGSLDITDTCNYNEHDFRIGVNNKCVAVYYEAAPDTTVVVSVSSVAFDEGNFVVTGTVQNVEELYIYLINTNVAASVDNYVEAVITDNTFTANLPLSTLIGYGKQNTPFNLRYRANDSQINVNIGEGDLDLTQTHSYDGYNFRLGLNGQCVAVYYEAAPVIPEPGEPDYSMSVSSMHFADGKFIVEGACGADVEKLIFHLHNTNSPVINFTSEAVIDNGEYRAEFVLSEIKCEDNSEPPTNYINVRYELNDDGYKSLNILPKDDNTYFVGASCKDGEKVWQLKARDTSTYLAWSAAPSVEENAITVYTMYFGNGKFIVEGGVGTGITELIFHMNNTTNPVVDCEFEAVISNGTFKVEIALSEIKNVNDAVPNAGTYINVRYEKNGDNNSGKYYNLLPGSNGGYATGATYTNEGKTWSLVADGSRTYIKWANA